MKTILITGGTNGIGKALAYDFAKSGYCVHIIGRNKDRGNALVKELNGINNAQNKFYSVDLSIIEENKRFLEEYKKENTKLDILVLNANIRPKKQVNITSEGYNEVLTTGFISRYLFTKELNGMLDSIEDSKIIHIGDARLIQNITEEKMNTDNVSGVKSLLTAYTGSAYMAYFLSDKKVINVHTEFINPGMVNTDTESASFWVKLLSKKVSDIVPRIATHIMSEDSVKGYCGFYNIDKVTGLDKKIAKKENEFNEFIRIADKLI